MSLAQSEENPRLQELKERIKQKFTFGYMLINSTQNEMIPVVGKMQNRHHGYCDHGVILRQEYEHVYDPGLDLVDLMDVDC